MGRRFQLGQYTFDASFDSANLEQVAQAVDDNGDNGVPIPHSFTARVRPDCSGTVNEKTYRTWFYFSVQGGIKGESFTMCIKNMNNREKIFRKGMKPVFRSIPSQLEWKLTNGEVGVKVLETDPDANASVKWEDPRRPVQVARAHTKWCPWVAKVKMQEQQQKELVKQRLERRASMLSCRKASAAGRRVSPSNQLNGSKPSKRNKTANESDSGKEDGAPHQNANEARARVPLRSRAEKKPKKYMEFTFVHTFKYTGEKTFFAYCVPFSYNDLQLKLQRLDKRFGFHCQTCCSGARAPCWGHECVNRREQKVGCLAGVASPAKIYYHRQVLARSKEGRAIDLLTITSGLGVTSEYEPEPPYLKKQLDTCWCGGTTLDTLSKEDIPLTYMEEDRALSNRDRWREANKTGDLRLHEPTCKPARGFGMKPIIFLSSRVHAGETPASLILNGFIDLLLQESNPHAIAMRDNFVFKIVPMLNPDGVYWGHFRCDVSGMNLNRFYECPKLSRHPEIFAVKKHLIALKERGMDIQKMLVTEESQRQKENKRREEELTRKKAKDQYKKDRERRRVVQEKKISQRRNRHRKSYTNKIERDEERPLATRKIKVPKSPSTHILFTSKTHPRVNGASDKLSSNKSPKRKRPKRRNGGKSRQPIKQSPPVADGSRSEPLIDLLVQKTTSSSTNSSQTSHSTLEIDCKENESGSNTSPDVIASLVGDKSLAKSPRKGIPLTSEAQILNKKAWDGNRDRGDKLVQSSSTPPIGNDEIVTGDFCLSLVVEESEVDHQGDKPENEPLDEGLVGRSEDECATGEIEGKKNLSERERAQKKDKRRTGRFHRVSSLSGASTRNHASHQKRKKFSKEKLAEILKRLPIGYGQVGNYGFCSRLCQRDDSRVWFYIDLHAHANCMGFFVYGNSFHGEKQVCTKMFAHALQMNCRFFKWKCCSFSRRNMTSVSKGDGQSKQGSGRVAMFHSLGIPHCYTLEANYFSGPLNIIHPKQKMLYNGELIKIPYPDTSAKTVEIEAAKAGVENDVSDDEKVLGPQYSEVDFESMGRSVALAILDVTNCNPNSRLPNSQYCNLRRLAESIKKKQACAERKAKRRAKVRSNQ